MLAHQHFLSDLKENNQDQIKIKASDSLKQTDLKNTRKGLKSRSLNSVDTGNVDQSTLKFKKTFSESGDCKSLLKEKVYAKPVFKPIKEEKVESVQDDWPEIENMYIYDEPDDDYEDILPKCERIQQSDLDSLFVSFAYHENFSDSIESLCKPSLEDMSLDFPKPPSPAPSFADNLYDDTPLFEIPF